MPPKNARPNEKFEVVATICPCEDGTFCLVAIDGVKLPEDEEEDDEMETDDRTDSTNIKLPYEEEDDD